MPGMEIYGSGQGVFVAPEGASDQQLAARLGVRPRRRRRRRAGVQGWAPPSFRNLNLHLAPPPPPPPPPGLAPPPPPPPPTPSWAQNLSFAKLRAGAGTAQNRYSKLAQLLKRKATTLGSDAVTDKDIMAVTAAHELAHVEKGGPRWSPIERAAKLNGARKAVEVFAREADAEIAKAKRLGHEGMHGESNPGEQLNPIHIDDPLLGFSPDPLMGYKPEDAASNAADLFITQLGGLEP